MAAADEQYGNKGYGQIGSQGGNPYDERDQNPAGDRYNNFSQGPYDDRTSSYLYRSTHERATAWLEEQRSFVCSARKRCLEEFAARQSALSFLRALHLPARV
jgi:hypothetical protein